LVGARAQLAERDREMLLVVQQNAALREQVTLLTGRLAELERRLGRNPRT